MTYLQRLQQEKQAREQYERDELRLKMLIHQINDCHIQYDGAFLDSLERFMELYRHKRMYEPINVES